MKVYSLVGGFDYEGENLLGVFATKEDLLKFIDTRKQGCDRRPETLGYDSLGFVESELGQPIDYYGEVEYL